MKRAINFVVGKQSEGQKHYLLYTNTTLKIIVRKENNIEKYLK
jgi:hypothetical protein